MMRADGCEITVKHLSVFLCGCRIVESDGISSPARSQFPAEELPARVRKDSQHTQHGLFGEKSCLRVSLSQHAWVKIKERKQTLISLNCHAVWYL